MSVRVVPLILLACIGWLSCRSAGPGAAVQSSEGDPRTVTLQDLARYYAERSDGLISCSIQSMDQLPATPVFSWDPYDKQRILATSIFGPEEIQDLFELNEECFVGGSGTRDFLDRAYQEYDQYPFDWKTQSHHGRYRRLAHWGSLLYPPIRRLREPLSFYHAGFSGEFDPDTASSEYFDPRFQIALDRETQTELTYGNRLQALFNGIESYPAKIQLIENSRKFLFVAVMTIVADETGTEILRRLVQRRRAGVDVRVIMDDFYTFSVSRAAMTVLEREGIPVARVADKKLNQADRMFHNKFWIRDGEEAIVGGMNVLDYEHQSNGFNFNNRDTDVRIQGPAVSDLTGRFITLWKRYDRAGVPTNETESFLARQLSAERDAKVRGAEYYATWLGDTAMRMNGICRIAVQGNNAEPQRIVALLTRYLQAARQSFYFTTPALEFDLVRDEPERIDVLAKVMLDKLSAPGFHMACVTNGVDGGTGEATAWLRNRAATAHQVGDTFWEDMLLPMIADDGRNVSRETRLVMYPLVMAGLHGYQYFNYMHAKQFYFDRLLVGIGSWNFDGFSAERNHECAVFCLDKGLRLQLERQLVLDMINSVPIVTRGTKSRPVGPGR